MMIQRGTWADWAEVVRSMGYTVAQCSICELWCVAREGEDPILEGRAQPVLDTRVSPPVWLTEECHRECPDKLLKIADKA